MGGLRGVTQPHQQRSSFSPTRALSIFRIPLLAGAVVMLGFSGYLLVQGPKEIQVGGQGASGEAITVAAVEASWDAHPDLDVYSDAEVVESTACRDSTGHVVDSIGSFPQGDLTLDGRRWFGTGTTVPTATGEQVTCTAQGATQVLLVHRTGMYRSLQAALFALAGFGGLVLGLIGLGMARRQRRLGS